MSQAVDIHSFTIAPAVHATETKYVIIRTEARLSQQQQDILKEKQCVPQDILADNVYLCSHNSSDLDAIKNLPFVKHVDVYRPAHKIASHRQINTPLTAEADSTADGPPASAREIPAIIALHQDSSATTVIKQLQDDQA